MSQELERLAHRLRNDPRRIFNWVRANVTFEPGWGSVLGAEGCRQTLSCDAHDTASLLLALLEAAGHDARYVTGVVDVDAKLFKSAVGDMETVAAASRAAQNAGWPHEVVSYGKRVRIAHVWVEAPVEAKGGRWKRSDRRRNDRFTALDAALKPHRFFAPDDLPFDEAAFTRDLAATFTHDPQTATINGFDEASFDARVAAVTDASFASLEHGRPGTRGWLKKLGRLLGRLAPDVHPLPVHVSAKGSASGKTGPPGRTVEVSGRHDALPDAIRHRVEVSFPGAGGDPAATSLNLDELVGERLTVDFSAADPAATDAVATAGGPWAVAPRSILLRPVLIAEGEPVLNGALIPFTDFQAVQTRVIRPDGVIASEATNFLRAGGVGALVIDPVRIGFGTVEAVRDRIGALSRRVEGGGVVTSFDELHGEWLLAHGVAYFSLVDIATELAAHRLDVREVAAVPGIAMVSWQPVPGAGSVTAGSVQIDAQQIGTAGGVARDGDPVRSALHRQAAGAFSSGMERGVFGSMLGVNATSTVDLLRRALESNQPIGGIVDDASLATVFANLNAPANVRDFIANSVANGFDVFVPLSPTTIGDWTGTGWMQLRDDGAFGFLLTGAISGGAVTDSGGDVGDALYGASVEGALDAAGQSSNVSLSTGAKTASFVLAPMGAGMETYETIKEVQYYGGSTGLAVATGISTGLVKGAYGMATGVAATAAAAAGGGRPGFMAVAAYGEYHAEQATNAIKDFALCGTVPCP